MFSRPTTNRIRSTPRRGLTLLEMLLVTFILATVAMSAVQLTDRVDSQLRFDETKRKRDDIRQAIVFDSSVAVLSQPLARGFAADLGRLPNNLDELVNQGTISAWQYDTTTGQWAGWRGPYVDYKFESTSGLKAYRDGWGNADLLPANDALYFGWVTSVNQTTGVMTVQSLAADRLSDGSPGAGTDGYELDYPDVANTQLIAELDHRINLKGWEVWVEFRNDTGGNVNPPDDLRIRVYYPDEDGSGGFDWPDPTIPTTDAARDVCNYLTLDAKLTGTLLPGETKNIRFRFTQGAIQVDKMIPAGARTMIIMDENTGAEYDPSSNNEPVGITLVPNAFLPTSTQHAPLFSWECD